MKSLPLSRLHQELGARMAVFAGYEMPIKYAQGIVHEHLHCRKHAGLFDVSHMGQCRVTGQDAAPQLERWVPSDIVALPVGHQKYTVLTNDKGGIIDDIIVSRLPDGYLIVVNATCKDKDFNHLSSRLGGNCRFEELSGRALFALQGPGAAGVMQQWSATATRLSFMQVCETTLGGMACIVSRSGYTGEDGFEISVDEAHAETLVRMLLAEPGVEPIGLGARDTLRLEAGLCLYGHELDETVTPVEAGLQWLVRWDRQNFPGADIIVGQIKKGVVRKRVGLTVDDKLPVREGSGLFNLEGLGVGRVTSGSFAPSVGWPVAMAYIEPDFAKIGTPLYASVRNHRVPVSVTRMPFYPHRYHR